MQQLTPSLGISDLLGVGISNVIGGGIFVLFASILRQGSSSAVPAFLAAAVPTALAAMTYAELAGMYRSNVAEESSIRDAFGPAAANVAAYVMLAFLVCYQAAMALFAADLIFFSSGSGSVSVSGSGSGTRTQTRAARFFVCTAVLLVLTAISCTGIQVSGTLIKVITVVEVALLTSLIVAGARHWRLRHLWNARQAAVSSGFWDASFLCIFLYAGYDALIKVSEETIRPEKDVPRATLATVAITGAIYVLLALTAVSHPAAREIANSDMPIGRMSGLLLGAPSAVVNAMSVGIVMSALLVGIIGISRFMHGLSRKGLLPMLFSSQQSTLDLSTTSSATGTPYVAVMAASALTIIAVLVGGSNARVISLANIACLVLVTVLHAALVLLRRRFPDAPRPFKVPTLALPVAGALVNAGYIAIGLRTLLRS